MNGTYVRSRLIDLTCSKVPGFWMVEHQFVILVSKSTRLLASILHKLVRQTTFSIFINNYMEAEKDLVK